MDVITNHEVHRKIWETICVYEGTIVSCVIYCYFNQSREGKCE